jgi:hypothetical protein
MLLDLVGSSTEFTYLSSMAFALLLSFTLLKQNKKNTSTWFHLDSGGLDFIYAFCNAINTISIIYPYWYFFGHSSMPTQCYQVL